MMKFARFGMLAALAATSTVAVSQLTVHVSLSGNDKWSGSLKSANRKRTDGPKKTLAGARDAIRKFKLANPNGWKGATVLIGPGNYFLTESLVLSAEDSGTADAPIVWKPIMPGKTLIDGGKVLTLWSSASRLYTSYLKPEVRNKVLQCNLKQMKIADLGTLVRRGMNTPASATAPELFWDNTRMQLAKYPNSGWLRIPEDHDGNSTTFGLTDSQPTRWKYGTDIWAYGFFRYNWADFYEKVLSIDAAKSRVTIDNRSAYGIGAKQRYIFVNVLEELDQPGEYYIDRNKKMLFFYPPVRSVGRRASLSLLDGPLVLMRDAAYVRFENIVFQHSRRTAIELHRSRGNSFAGCVVRNTGSLGVYVNDSYDNVFDSCDVTSTGETGIFVKAGDRKSLTPGNNVISNCHLWATARTCKTYYPAVDLEGVGNVVRNCRIENVPHSAIVFRGNNHLIENNEISRACLETGDSGAVYTGRDFTEQGTIIRNNLFQDLRGLVAAVDTGPNEVYAIGFDDCASGTTVYGNIFRRVDYAVGIGGGRDHVVQNNVFDQVGTAVFVGDRDPAMFEQWGFQAKLDDVKHTVPPYSLRYPRLANILNDDPMVPKRNLVSNNVYADSGQLLRTFANLVVSSTDGQGVNVISRSNYVGLNPGFVDLAKNDFRLLPGSAAEQAGFVPFETARIGLQVTGYRSAVAPLPGPAGQ